ncbi:MULTISPECIES: phosphomevalonate kinase [Oceanobacillus]|uniref:phosphomevalonate kinase n=1 Tax=Oceanobacillus TaxID=182709 RepID=UPI001BEA00FA|nr:MULTISPECIES: phosphomevalonate kinase [Oceanobacillus]MBT2653251.1 phosphomevalonate kinase [Oceanobacillus sp. ISL-73]MCT1577872.1 phosphomevalonate kinase [Oceanobacillus kimchii]MCT2136860.1 phosphomevalonate kinase [Oceanobacillus kimchii]
MSKRQLTVKVPGKLMIAGEFAVLEPYQKLAVMAVNRYVYATIADSENYKLSLENYGLHDIAWTYQTGTVNIQSDDERFSFVKDAIHLTCTYLEEQNTTITPFHLSTRSELDDASGVKYGLGSSAAIVTSVVSAILRFVAPRYATKEIIFRLAALSHVCTQGNGSGADIAASTYGGFRQYSSFQADWLLNTYQNASTISEVVDMEWKYYQSENIRVPDFLNVCVGWTGTAASTKNLVQQIRLLKVNDLDAYEHFLQSSKQAVRLFLEGMNRENLDMLINGVRKNRQALARVGEKANTPIETSMLTKLCDVAEQLGGAGKPSGAGGGDCGIAFMYSKDQVENLFHSWKEVGIKPLTLQPSLEGEHVVINE